MKKHHWTEENDKTLKLTIDECEPLFEHFREQGKTYSEKNAWDAVAGRLLPDICVTGAACRRRWEVLKTFETEMKLRDDTWQKTIDMVNKYELDLQETTFDGVSEILGNMDAVHERITGLESKIDTLINEWRGN